MKYSAEKQRIMEATKYESLKHLAKYMITHYDKETGVVTATEEYTSLAHEYLTHQNARPDFEKLIPGIPCIFTYIESMSKEIISLRVEKK